MRAAAPRPAPQNDVRPRVRLTPEAFAKPPGGVRRAAVQLLAALREAGADVSAAAFVDEAITVTSSTPSALRRAALQAAEAAFFARRGLRRESGVAHSLYYDQQVRAADWPLVVTVHDMIHERFGAGSTSLRWAKRLAVHQAALVVVPSRASASDLAGIFPDVASKVITIPWGVAPAFLEGDPDREVVRGKRPFLLYVGARSGYKNLAVLVRALAETPELDDFRLLLVGGEPLLEAERSVIVHALRDRDRLVHVASLPDEALRDLYDTAGALVVTSRCEGFGLPLLEAMARGCPVASADARAAVEVSDGHAVTFPADSPQACAGAIRQALALNSSERRSARDHARRYTWAAAARAHIDAYRGVEIAACRRRASDLSR